MIQIKEITSPANPIIKDMRALSLRKTRKETGLYLVEGLRSVREGLDLHAPLKKLVYAKAVRDRADIKQLVKTCLERDVQVMEVSEPVLEKLSRKDNPQSVIGVFEQVRHTLSAVKPDANATWVVLEQVRDPGNLGTIMRTIDAVGASGVILLDTCCDPFSVEATRATMGSLFAVPLVECTMAEFTAFCKNWTGGIYGTTLQPDSVDFRSVHFTRPMLLVMGNEQAGLTQSARTACKTLVKLPMLGRADSLNLSVATGILLYAALTPWNT